MATVRSCDLSLELLGVPVQVHCQDPEHHRRLEVCYGESLRADTREPAVVARLDQAPDRSGAWRIRASGRADSRAPDWTLGVRVLNHELMHAAMLRNRSLYYVHASVVRMGERGILMPGLSQAGKSTLALAFVTAGAQYLSDELLAFDPARCTALAFPRALKIRDVCSDYFPTHQSRFTGEGEARFLPFDALAPGAVAASTRIDVILAPHWAGEDGTTSLTPISTGRALLDLAASSLNFGTHREQSVDCLADVVRGTRCFELNWRDPHEAVAEVLRAIEP